VPGSSPVDSASLSAIIGLQEINSASHLLRGLRSTAGQSAGQTARHRWTKRPTAARTSGARPALSQAVFFNGLNAVRGP